MRHLEEVLFHLAQAEAYPHPVSQMRVMQTHASCVFLTGEFAYKVKKPVDFGFLDYSSLEKREQCCREELRLNARLCPEVYLGVVPIQAEGGRLRVVLDGRAAGPVVEWALRMRQLPEEEMLPHRLARGTVSVTDVLSLARLLAEFHARAETGPEVDRWGTAEAVSRLVDENFAQTISRVDGCLPETYVREIAAYARQFLRTQAKLFRARVAAGRIREGHGDLRLQNICLAPEIGSGIQVFDCIEFSPAYRCGDVAADLAYLTMDLDLAGRADLRAELVAAYVAASGDVDLLRLRYFYQCYRAFVRGKIALLASEQSEIPAAERAEHLRLGAAAFDLARAYAQTEARPWLVAVGGLSGSGKSTLARELARRLPAVHLASDVIRKKRAGVPATAPLGGAHYAETSRKAVYAELWRQAREWLRRGEHVLLDATFLDPAERCRVAELAEEAGAVGRVIWCYAPDSVIRERLPVRSPEAAHASDATLEVYEQQVRRYGGNLPAELSPDVLRLETVGEPGALAREVLSQLLATADAGSPCQR